MSSWSLSLSRDTNISLQVLCQMSLPAEHGSQKKTCFAVKLNVVPNTDKNRNSIKAKEV